MIETSLNVKTELFFLMKINTGRKVFFNEFSMHACLRESKCEEERVTFDILYIYSLMFCLRDSDRVKICFY